jgi:transposase InsO family protein
VNVKQEETMPWNEISTVELRRDFVALAKREDANIRWLCHRFGISTKTGYKWLERFAQGGVEALVDRSRRPQSSPRRTDAELEQAVLGLRAEHPAWGGRKLARRLSDLSMEYVPAPSTITAILRRHGLLGTPDGEGRQRRYHRFEHEAPNQLWQIDFKSPIHTPHGICHTLTVLDDHSRYNLVLHACRRPGMKEVQPALINAFRRYGLPVRINGDNGAPWGSPREPAHGISKLSVWLIRLGIRVSHSRPYHPQTNGKDERFHRSLDREVLNGVSFADQLHLQGALSRWRQCYNHERPHEALDMAVPATRYVPSQRNYPEKLPVVEYGPDDMVARVGWNGELRVLGRRFKVSNALTGLDVALRPNVWTAEGLYDLYFCHQRIGKIDLRAQEK